MITAFSQIVYEESDPPTFIFTLPTGRLATIIRRPLTIWSSIHIGESLRSGKSLHGKHRQQTALLSYRVEASCMPTGLPPPNGESVARASARRRHPGEKGALIGPRFRAMLPKRNAAPLRALHSDSTFPDRLPTTPLRTDRPASSGQSERPKKDRGSRECRGLIPDKSQSKRACPYLARFESVPSAKSAVELRSYFSATAAND